MLPAGLNNIHCYYGVESIAYENPKWAMKLCAKMSNVPKKDRCYETIAKQIANKNYSLAAANCNKIRGFSGVHSIEDCYGTISEKAEKE
ncbi:hypothetical protein KJ891_01855 [Candidatus Micrarchaeota archaeon]|nr:hypothetical protein [Candidatus Micrarchaeota archaeon]